MDKSRGNNEAKWRGVLSYALTSTAMVMLLLNAGIGNNNYDINADTIMNLYLPVIVLLLCIWIPMLKVMRLVKQ
jgi:hypothetical protein